MVSESDNPDAAPGHSTPPQIIQPDQVDLQSKIDKCDQLARILEPSEEDRQVARAATPHDDSVYPPLKPDPAFAASRNSSIYSSGQKDGFRAELCYIDLDADTLQHLEAGDVLTTSQLLEQPVLIYQGQQIIATAELAVRDGRYVLNITSTNSEPPSA